MGKCKFKWLENTKNKSRRTNEDRLFSAEQGGNERQSCEDTERAPTAHEAEHSNREARMAGSSTGREAVHPRHCFCEEGSCYAEQIEVL